MDKKTAEAIEVLENDNKLFDEQINTTEEWIQAEKDEEHKAWYTEELKSLKTQLNAHSLAIKSLQSGWINVEDELPENDINIVIKESKYQEYIKVLVYSINASGLLEEEPEIIYRSREKKTNIPFTDNQLNFNWKWSHNCLVTHWQPLPDTPNDKVD